jgi:hypothetical protein
MSQTRLPYFLSLCLCLFFAHVHMAYAADAIPGQAAAEEGAKVKATPKFKPLGDTKYKKNWKYCPKADQLVVSNQEWGVEGGWQTMGISFATSIIAFEGAHWSGVNLGKIICLYRGEGVTFPVSIGRTDMVLRPVGRYWKDINSDATSLDCVRSSPNDCPFVFQDDISGSSKNIKLIYNEIMGIK